MAFGTVTTEVAASIPPKRLWMAFVRDSVHFLPQALPDVFTGASIIEGDGGVGSVQQFHVTTFNKDFVLWEKLKVDAIDEENLSYRYTALDGGVLGTKIKAARFEMKFTPTDDEGCLIALTCEYETLSDSAPSEVEIQETKAAIVAAVKMVESYLLSNPAMYL